MIILRKCLIAGTGLFICVFLVAHLGANFLLLLPETQARALYNAYSKALRENLIVTVIAYLNYACILLHVGLSIVITLRNRASKGQSPIQNRALQNSSWTSQNMGFLGTLLLAFLILHMANFWYRVKFVGEDQDLYGMVLALFREPAYVIVYVVAMLPLGLHLAYGVKSGLRSLGLYHSKFLRWTGNLAVGFAWVAGIGFAVIPCVLYFRQVGL